MFLFVLSCFSKWRKQHLVAGAVIFSQFVSDKSDKSVSLFSSNSCLLLARFMFFEHRTHGNNENFRSFRVFRVQY
jgi:hypothetical protein